MKPDDLAGLVANAGLDPDAIALEQGMELIREWAELCAGYAMAEVKDKKVRHLITREEAWAAFDDWTTPGDEALTARTMRAGENAIIGVLFGHGLYSERLARLRLKTN